MARASAQPAARSEPVPASVASVLPPEVWAQVLNQLHEDDLQHTSLALSRAIPNSGVTLKDLFSHLRITRDQDQANQLVRRLGPRFKDADFVKSLVITFANRAWRTDSQLLINLGNAFPKLRSIDFHIGPLFAQEHFEELIEKPRPSLQRLALRFNPYVDKASYTIFLKGLYFDTGLIRMARWPLNSNFKELSLVQDPIPSHKDLVAAAFEAGAKVPTKGHAQPIVFFKLSCISTLAAAPISAFVERVRLRIPNRSILTAISTASTSSTVLPATHSATLPKPFPALTHLDISTTYVSCDAAFQGLLKRHPSLRHLVADRSGLIHFGMPDEACRDIGKVVATIGVNRAVESTKVYRAAFRAMQERARAAVEAQRRAQMTSSELAALEDQERMQALETDVQRARRGRSGYASERRPRGAQTRNDPAAATALAEALASMSLSAAKKPIILPSAPSLSSLCCGVNEHEELDDDLREEWEEDFHEGYEQGLEYTIAFVEEKLVEYRRMEARARNATAKSPEEDRMFPQLMRFRTPEEREERLERARQQNCSVEDLEDESQKDVLSHMDLVPCDVSDAMALIDQIKSSTCVLCTVADCANQGRIAFTDSGDYEKKSQAKWRRPASEHKPGCGHLQARRIWE